jgi:hypothetical protein
VQEQYGEVLSSVLNGFFLELPVGRKAEITAMPEQYGYTCTRDEKLTRQAVGNYEL